MTNNVIALVAALAVAALIFVIVAVTNTSAGPVLPCNIKVFRTAAFGVTTTIFTVFGVLFLAARKWFDGNVHIFAAVSLFACIIVVVALNAVTKWLGYTAATPVEYALTYFRWYVSIAGAMVLVLVTGGWMHGHGLLWMDKDYAFLYIEAGVLGLFLTFWIIQSVEQWQRLRAPDPTNLTILPTAG